MTCANADGACLLVVIGESAKPRALKNIMKSLPVYYTNQKSTWMNSAIFSKWFFDTFVSEVTKYLKNKYLPIKAVLLVDNASCHPDDFVLKKGNIIAKFLPANTTSIIQPMNQGIIENLKRRYKLLF